MPGGGAVPCDAANRIDLVYDGGSVCTSPEPKRRRATTVNTLREMPPRSKSFRNRAVFAKYLNRPINRQSFDSVPAPGCRRSSEKRIVHGFFGRFDHRKEQRRDSVVRDQLCVARRVTVFGCGSRAN